MYERLKGRQLWCPAISGKDARRNSLIRIKFRRERWAQESVTSGWPTVGAKMAVLATFGAITEENLRP